MLKWYMCSVRPLIKQKVTVGYYVIGALTLTLAVVILLELQFIEKKITAYDAVSEFYDVTLEVRRFEKNFLLYSQESDYREALKYLATAQELLETNIYEFNTLVRPQQVRTLRDDLKKYKELLQQYATARDEHQKTFLEGGVRKIGRDIVTSAQIVSKTERRRLQTTLKNYQAVLIISIISLSILGAGIFQILSKTVAHHPPDNDRKK